jgi:two-component system OmpR family response regulator
MQSQPQILVVDDDREIRTLLGRYLDGQGFRVSVAADRRECEQKLAAGQFDLIVLDVMLPDGSGPISVARCVTANGTFPSFC